MLSELTFLCVLFIFRVVGRGSRRKKQILAGRSDGDGFERTIGQAHEQTATDTPYIIHLASFVFLFSWLFLVVGVISLLGDGKRIFVSLSSHQVVIEKSGLVGFLVLEFMFLLVHSRVFQR